MFWAGDETSERGGVERYRGGGRTSGATRFLGRQGEGPFFFWGSIVGEEGDRPKHRRGRSPSAHTRIKEHNVRFSVRLRARFRDELRLAPLKLKAGYQAGRVERQPVWPWLEGGEHDSQEHRSEGLIRPLERECWRKEMSLRVLRRSGANGHESGESGRSV